MSLPAPIQAIVDFVRKGYPHGVPEHDYLPLFALLRRRLSDDEVAQVAAALAAQSATEQNPTAISDAIERLIMETPSETDIERVRVRLGEAGLAV
jgi:hypothetical protein